MKSKIQDSSLVSLATRSRMLRWGSAARWLSVLKTRIVLGSCLVVLFLTVSSPSNSPSASLKLATVASPRVVLAEHFTATYNAYEVHWVGAALRQIQEEVGPENFIVLAYHRNAVPNLPVPDPFANDDSVARFTFYNCCTNNPTTWFSGLHEVKNKGDMTFELWYSYFKPYYDTVKRTMSPVEISLTGAITMEAEDKYNAEIQATIMATDRIRGSYRVWFVLSEDDLMALGNFFPQPYRMTTFDWVVRDVLPNEPLTISQTGQQQMVSRSVMLDPTWKRENLNMTVFVQRASQGYEILQAASLDLQPPAEP